MDDYLGFVNNQRVEPVYKKQKSNAYNLKPGYCNNKCRKRKKP